MSGQWDDATLLCVEPAMQGGDSEFRYAKPVFIQSLVLGLHARASPSSEPQSPKEGGRASPSHQEIASTLHFSTDQHLTDAVKFEREGDADVSDVYKVESARSWLSSYTATLRQQDLSHAGYPEDASNKPPVRDAHKAAYQVMEGVSRFISESDSEQRKRSRKDLLRDLQVLDLLVQVTSLVQNAVPKPNTSAWVATNPQSPASPTGPGGKWHSVKGGGGGGDAMEGGAEAAQCLKNFCCAHEALCVAIQECPESGFAIRDYFELLQNQASVAGPGGQKAAKTLQEMLTGNWALKQWMPRERIDFFLAQVDRDAAMRAHNVGFLAMIAADGARGIRKNQDLILRKWLQDKKRSSLLIDTRSPEKGIVQVCIRQEADSGRHRFLDVESFCASSLAPESNDRSLYNFYMETLHLLAALCAGDNHEAKNLVGGPKGHVSYSALRQCIANERLPSLLRCKYAALLRHCYLSRPAVEYFNPTLTTFVLSDLESETNLFFRQSGMEMSASVRSTSEHAPAIPAVSLEKEMAFEGPRFEPPKECGKFEDLKRDALLVLSSHASAIVPEGEEGDNQLTVAAAQIVSDLLRLGFFHAEEIITNLLPPVLSVLDGYSDMISSPTTVGRPSSDLRYKRKKETIPIFQAKVELMKVLFYVMDLRLCQRLKLCLSLAERVGGIAEFTKSGTSIRILKGDATGIAVSNVAKRLQHPETMYTVMRILSYLQIPGGGTGKRLCKILLDFLKYDDEELSTLALRCLFRDCSPKLELFRAMNCVQVLHSTSEVQHYRSCQGHLSTIRLLTTSTITTLSRQDANQGVKPPTGFDRLIIAIAGCAVSCRDGGRAVREMMRRIGVLELVLDLMRAAVATCREDWAGETGDSKNAGWKFVLLRGICLFLEWFVTGNEENQILVQHHEAELLVFGIGHKLWDTASVLSAVYRDNSDLCSKVDLRLLDVVVGTLSDSPSLSGLDGKPRMVRGHAVGGRRMDYIELLKVLCNEGFQGEGNRRVQDHVMWLFRQHGPLVLGSPSNGEQALLLFRGAKGKERRDKLQEGALNTKSPAAMGIPPMEGNEDAAAIAKMLSQVEFGEQARGLLAYYAGLVGLMKELMVSGGQDNCALVLGLFPVDDITEDMSSASCPPEAKLGILQVFTSVYISRGEWVRDSRFGEHLSFLLYDLIVLLESVDSVRLCRSVQESLAVRDNDEPSNPPPRGDGKETREYASWELGQLLLGGWVPMLRGCISARGILAVEGRRKEIEKIVRLVMDVANNAQPMLPGEACQEIVGLWEESESAGLLCGGGPNHEVRTQILDYEDFIRESPRVRGSGGQTTEQYMVDTLSRRASGSGTGAMSARFGMFAKAFIEAVDEPGWDTEEEGEEGDSSNGEEEDGMVKFRREMLDLCGVFRNSPHPHLALIGGEVGDADGGKRVAGGEFKADAASHLVKVLSCMQAAHQKKLEAGGHKTGADGWGGVGEAWEVDTVLGVRTLQRLVTEWVSSVTEVTPPPWLLEGVPMLLVKYVSMQHGCGDTVIMCALELGIAGLHGGNEIVQNRFLEILRESLFSETFMRQMRDRLVRGQAEAMQIHRFSELVLSKGIMLRELSAMSDPDKTIQALVLPSVPGETDKLGGSNVGLVLRFLHMLCEGHNLSLQHYLRHQAGSERSIDLVSAVATYVCAVTPCLNPFNAKLQEKAWLALAEFVQSPCRPNQRVLVDTQLPTYANSALGISEIHVVGTLAKTMTEESGLLPEVKSYGRNIKGLKAAVVTALLAILECVDSDYIPNRLLEALDAGALVDNMNVLCLSYSHEAIERALSLQAELASFKDSEFGRTGSAGIGRTGSAGIGRTGSAGSVDHLRDRKTSFRKQGTFRSESSATPIRRRSAVGLDHGQILEALNMSGGGLIDEDEAEHAQQVAQLYYIAFITLMGFDQTRGMKRRLGDIWDLENFKKKVGVIEISRNGVLEKAHFIIPSVCQFLTNTTRQNILVSIDRSNLQTQLTDMSERFDMLYDEMKHQKWLNESLFLNFYRETYEWREKFFFFNAILMNAVILLFFGYKCQGAFLCGEQEDLTTYALKPGWREFVIVLASIQVLFAVTRQWWYVIDRGIPMVDRQVMIHAKTPPRNRLLAWIVKLPPEQSDPSFRHLQNREGMEMGDWRHLFRKINVVRCLYMLTDLHFLGISFMTTVNILALIITHEGGRLLLVAHLLEVFNHSRVLGNVMRSITYRGGTLLQTAGLALVWIYFFGVFGFMLFPELFQFNESDVMGGRKLEPNNNGALCTSIWKCSLVVLDMGFRKGDVGEGLDDIPWLLEDSSNPDQFRILYRMIYTLLFFILVTTILMNIIFGVIIDTFAELRAKKDAIDRDISGRCFICGIDRFVLDQVGETGVSGFEDHIENDHNMWKYLFFQVYLRQKDFSEYSGGESYVFSKTLDLVRHPQTHEILIDVDTGKELKSAKQQVDLLWFPQRDAMVLKKKRPTTDQLLVNKLHAMHESTEKTTEMLNAQVDRVLETAYQNTQTVDPDLRAF